MSDSLFYNFTGVMYGVVIPDSRPEADGGKVP